MFRLTLKAVAATFALAAGAGAHAASEIVPSQPSAFDPINLRINADSCTFNPSTVRVSKTDAAIVVRTQLNACLVAGEPRVVDIRVGTYPPGSYRVDLFFGDTPTPAESLRFEVVDRPEVAVFPPPIRPLTDYTGMWWNPLETGWALSLHQGASGGVFGELFVYGTNGEPQWFTFQPGGWTSYSRWNGNVYRTTGPSFQGPDYDPRLVLVQPVGSATIDFTQSPGTVGRATLEYTINGVTKTKTVYRFPL
ncbi:hypothetical protein [Usitatibacter palustris]|uniref:IPT/TIG domain-containing protein n=1 Tax=Usitatibacter palustris TaxID=2732487 RepID=A0A6M4H938_9PROT|nr:hypothetical protein [Usitatibacter palustris]QJR15328.1 hypothetical protein DSM104440_02147 [Usitatibacter palustris]